jgi:hypothetical protein
MCIEVKCQCGAAIPEDQIDYLCGCNEEGEDYGEVSATCRLCGKEYETFQWRCWDDKNEAIEYLKNYIKENK